MDKILEGLVTSSHPLNLKKVIVKKVVESAENSVSEEQCKAMFSLTTRLILEGQDPFQKQVGHQVLEAYARYHRSEFENYFNRNFVLSLLQEGYRSLERKDVAILDYIHNGLKLIMSCPSILDIFSVLQVEVLRIVCERPEPFVAARLSELLTDFVQCIPKGKLSIAFCQQLVRTIGHFQCISTFEKELREYVSQVTKVSNLLQNIWKAEPCTLLPSLQEVFAIISSTDASFEPSVSLASLVQHIPLQLITVLIRSLTTDPNVKDASMTQALCRMIDWLSWPLAQHVETWVIALLKGLAAVQKFTILIDVTLQKIELVFHRLWFPLVRPGALAVLSHMLLSFQHSPEAFHMVVPHVVSLVQSFKNDGLPTITTFLAQFAELMHCMIYHFSGFPDLYEPILEALKREAYAPQTFFDASRPPWFTPRSQQDCSEYLRFLLDRLDEEEKTIKALCSKLPLDASVHDCIVEESSASVSDDISNHYCTKGSKGCGNKEKSLIENMFGGKLQTNICCLNCRSTSQKREAFTDLSLAFCPTLVDKPVQSTLGSPKQKDDDDCIETDIASSTLAPSTEDVNVGPENEISECEEVKTNVSCVLDNSVCANAIESDEMPTQNNRRERTLSVTDLLNYFLAPEILDGDNQYYCEKCASLQNAKKTMQIMEEPEYLILTLLRFSYDPKCHVRRKIMDNVSIPLVLELPVERTTSPTSPGDWTLETDIPDVSENLAKKLKPSNTEDLCCSHPVPYVLSSVVVHSGTSSESGHYYSYARNVTSTERCLYAEKSCYSHGQLVERETGSSVMTHKDTQCNDISKEWFLFNDSRVTFTSFQSVLNITSRFPKDTAYVLIYRKHNFGNLNCIQPSSANGLWVNGEPPLQKELMDAITKDNLLYLQEQELNARARALQNTSASCSFRPNGFDDNDPPGSCGPSGGGGDGGFSTLGRLVF
uniref:Ubiquitin-specific peptidase 38 n=1 Tax=Xenopus tropicalis TaxID=8364 RepID=A0A6I8SDB7_XENTR